MNIRVGDAGVGVPARRTLFVMMTRMRNLFRWFHAPESGLPSSAGVCGPSEAEYRLARDGVFKQENIKRNKSLDGK